MTTRGKFLCGVVLIVGAVGYLMYTGIRETSTYYFTIEEFLLKKEALANEGVRVAGRVQAESVSWNPKDLNLSFRLAPLSEDPFPAEKGVLVRYQGILPDMFDEGRDVIVEGQYTLQDGENGESVLLADTVMTSCPSKYEAEQPEA